MKTKKRRKAVKRPGEAKSRRRDQLCWRGGCEAEAGSQGRNGCESKHLRRIQMYAEEEKGGFYCPLMVGSSGKEAPWKRKKYLYSELEIIAGLPLAEVEADESKTIH